MMNFLRNTRFLIALLLAFVQIGSFAQTKYVDYRMSSVYRGVPTSIIEDIGIAGRLEETYENGMRIKVNGETVDQSLIQRDANNRIVSTKDSPNDTPTKYEWYEYDYLKSISKEGRYSSVISYEGGTLPVSQTTNGNRTRFLYTKFDSYGNWIERKYNLGMQEYKDKRTIIYEKPKGDNIVRILDNDGNAIISATVYVCNKKGEIRTEYSPMGTDMNGYLINPPYGSNLMYFVSYINSCRLVSASDPNCTISLQEPQTENMDIFYKLMKKLKNLNLL